MNVTRKACRVALILIGIASGACSPGPSTAPSESADQPAATPPTILLVTLDTVRADAIGPESNAVETPTLSALAARGLRFEQAYATAPMTLPSHASMLTGLYPAEHGVHENARRLADDPPLLASRLQQAGYTTAAFVSGYPLDRRFGLARGFDHYDDDLGDGAAERGADATTANALAYLSRQPAGPLFLWVHYFDPHEPYAPPEPFRSRYPEDPYLGEIAFMDRELGRLLAGLAQHTRGEPRILVVGDHGESRGDHGETFHGNLLYQGVMRVPLILAGPGVPAATRPEPVSTRRVFDTVLAWAGLEASRSLLEATGEAALGEAMRPFLQYGWQPQVMAVRGRHKVIRSGTTEVYDVVADPAEGDDLAGRVELDPELRRTLRAYPLPAAASAAPVADLAQEEAERLASLGYASWEGSPALRRDAPSPKDRTHLFADLDLGSGWFVRREYAHAIPIFERVLEQDENNLMVCLRLAVAHSLLDEADRALAYFERAERIEPGSIDRRHYLAMHHLRSGQWGEAAPLFESVLAHSPDRLPALEGLARIREAQGRIAEAAELLERAVVQQSSAAASLAHLGQLHMALGDTPAAIGAFERARDLLGEDFAHFLELGVCYLADRRLAEAADSLDRVGPSHPAYPMALFKRAQVAVLLAEPDRARRIRLARDHADETTRGLIANERLFRAEGSDKR